MEPRSGGIRGQRRAAPIRSPGFHCAASGLQGHSSCRSPLVGDRRMASWPALVAHQWAPAKDGPPQERRKPQSSVRRTHPGRRPPCREYRRSWGPVAGQRGGPVQDVYDRHGGLGPVQRVLRRADCAPRSGRRYRAACPERSAKPGGLLEPRAAPAAAQAPVPVPEDPPVARVRRCMPSPGCC
jgi:hypothetical protein